MRPTAARRPVRGTLLELASMMTAADDKQLAAALAQVPAWAELAPKLPAMRADALDGYLCGPPPPRPPAMGAPLGEEAQLAAMLKQLSMDGGAGIVTG